MEGAADWLDWQAWLEAIGVTQLQLVLSWTRALLLAVFPANIYMAVEGVFLPLEWLPQSQVGLWVRLPFQAVFAAMVGVAGLWTPTGE